MTTATKRASTNRQASSRPYGHPEPSERRVWLTPSDAEKLLKFNTHNRKMNDVDVMKYAIEMAEGRWQYNGEPIKFDWNNVLLDGQQRLTALSLQEAKQPDGTPTRIEFLIVENLPPESQVTMDGGRQRSVSDQLAVMNIEVDKSTASALRLLMRWESGWFFGDMHRIRAQLATSHVVAWAQEHSGEVTLLKSASRFRKIEARAGMVLAAYAIIAINNSVENADEFFQRLLDGVDLQYGSPILALRNRFATIKYGKQRSTDREQLGMIIQTFNNWMKGVRCTKVQLPRGGSFTPENWPQVRTDTTRL